jgi:AcrR family transcriptional regulator
MAMPPDNGTDVRQRILDAALGLMAEQGFMEVTQPKIARAAGVRQSHLTYYFPTRSELLKALAMHSIESMLGSLAAGASEGKLTPELFARFAGEALADKRRARVMLGLIVSSEGDREIKQFLRDFIARVRVAMTGVAKLLGREPEHINVVALHMLFVGATIMNIARDDANSRRECAEIARLAVETFLPGDTTAAAQKRKRRTK